MQEGDERRNEETMEDKAKVRLLGEEMEEKE